MKKILLLLPLLLLFYSCPNDTTDPRDPKIEWDGINKEFIYNFEYSNDNEFAYELMKEIYLWYDEVPALQHNIETYNSPQDIFNELAHENDEWSYAVTKQEHSDWLNGEAGGYGCYFDIINYGDYGYQFRILTLQKDSPFYIAGARRGDQILSIDGYTANQVGAQLENNNFELYYQFLNSNSAIFEIDTTKHGVITEEITKRTISVKTVDNASILEGTNKVTGYLSFNSFIASSFEELNSAFDYFENHNIEELIIDLRYNGGGSVDVANHFVNILIGNKYSNYISTRLSHNSLYRHWNYAYFIENGGFDFNFEKIYFLTNRGTASASEMVINSLNPYIETYVIGENSYGKPVGMFGLTNEESEYIYLPITFKYDNANGVSDFYDGLPLDSKVMDSFSYDYGEENDPLISSAIYHINNGVFPSDSRSIEDITKSDFFKLKGFDRQKGFF